MAPEHGDKVTEKECRCSTPYKSLYPPHISWTSTGTTSTFYLDADWRRPTDPSTRGAKRGGVMPVTSLDSRTRQAQRWTRDEKHVRRTGAAPRSTPELLTSYVCAHCCKSHSAETQAADTQPLAQPLHRLTTHTFCVVNLLYAAQ